jgi:RND family efflux transporter MFP subunit
MTEQQPDAIKRKNVPLRILIVVIILAVGIGGAIYLKKTAPQAKKIAPVKRAQLVEVVPAQYSAAQIKITSYGTIVAARQITLQSQISGQVIALNPKFDVGSRLLAGNFIVQIEPQDYQLEVERQQAAVQKAQAAFDLELGQQNVAKQEWQAYQQSGAPAPASTALALRQPYLNQARAEQLAAQAALEQAQLDLQRATISAPFDCLVLTKDVDLGAQLKAQGNIAALVGTDVFWAEVTVPTEQLAWIDIPGVNSSIGALAHIQPQDSTIQRTGQVIKLLGSLADGGRMARLLVAIPDPLDLNQPLNQRQPLLLGDYVAVTLQGRSLERVVKAPRSIVHNGNQIWVATADNTLSVREVNIVWKDLDQVYIDQGLAEGEAIVVSNLATPVSGMSLRRATAVSEAQ